MQTLQRLLSKIVHADCKEYYLKLYMQTLQRVLSTIVHANSAKSII